MLKDFFHDLVCVYTTTRLIRVKSPLVAIVSFIITLTVLWSYIASIRLDYRRAFQSTCPVQGAVISKVKGYVSTKHLNDSELSIEHPELYRNIWDASDLVFPVQGGEGETGGFTIVTNMKFTANQTIGLCSEGGDENITKLAPCSEDAECTEEWFGKPATHGMLTGKCDNVTESCEVEGWCPLENRILPRGGLLPLLEGLEKFTVMLKNTVEFPGCTVDHGSNVLNSNKSYLRNCVYDYDSAKLCPIFTIGELVAQSGHDFNEVAVKGGVFRIRIVWKCDFDRITSLSECFPRYEFSRVDDTHENVAAQGWNFRSAEYEANNKRTLTKYFGLKFIVSLEGEGTQRDVFLFVTTLGSYLGLFSVVSLVCDLLLDIMNSLWKWNKAFASLHEYGDRYGDEPEAVAQKSRENLESASGEQARRRKGTGSEKEEKCLNPKEAHMN